MILLSSTVFRHKVARERELGIASRRSCWFGRPRTAPPSCGHRDVSGRGYRRSVLTACWPRPQWDLNGGRPREIIGALIFGIALAVFI